MMENTPRFPSLFFRQRLNATVLPMLGGISLFLLLPIVAATLVSVALSVVLLVFVFRREGEKRKILLCILAGLSLALLLMGLRGLEHNRMEKLCHVPREAEGFVVATGEGSYDLALCRLDGEGFYKRVRVESDAHWKMGEKRKLSLILYTPDPTDGREEGIDLLAYCHFDGGVIGESRLYSFVGKLRQSLLSDFSRRENGGFLAAILLGDRSGLTQGQTDAFRRTASSHILAISGLHISQTVAFGVCLLRLFPMSRRTLRLLLFPLVGVLYLLAGAGISVFRASVMTLFSMVGLLLRSRSDSVTSLSFSAALLVLSNPYALESPSFLLSYASTFGIITCAVPLGDFLLERSAEKDFSPFAKLFTPLLTSLVMASVSFVFTLPVQLLLFDTATPFAPIYAVLLVPLFQICLILTLLGAGTTAVPSVSAPLEKILLGVPSRFPDLVEFFAQGAPDPVNFGAAGVMIALFFIVMLVVMFGKKLPLKGVFLLHGIAVLLLGLLSLLQNLIS